MEESYSMLEDARNMEPIMFTTQESTPRNWNEEPIIPDQHLVTPIGSTSQGSMNNSTCSSSHQYDVLSLLEGIVNEKHIEETLIQSKLLSCNFASIAATATATATRIFNERERNDCGENDRRQHDAYRDLVAKTIGSKSSVYRGVIKCNDERFEAFVWDNTDPGERGRTGAYSTEVDAAKAHDLVAIRIGGLKALTNFHMRCYSTDMDEMRRMNKWDYICAVRRLGKGYTDGGDSPFRGVYRNRVPTSRKWEARLGREGSPTIHLGTYYTAEDAARAYDIISIKLKGGDAITNFDSKSYETEGIMESVITQATDGSIILQKEKSNKETEASPQTSSVVQHHPQPPSVPSICRCCHNQIPPSSPYALGGITGGAANSGSENSIGNDAAQIAQFPNESATLQQPLQTPRQVSFNNCFDQNFVINNNQFPNHNATQQLSLLTPRQVSFSSSFNQNLVNNYNNNNQFLPQSSNLALPAPGTQNLDLERCVRFPDWRSGFGKKLLGGGLELEPLSNIAALNVQPLPQVSLNESTGATQLHSPALHQSYEHQNLNSCFSDSFQNPISEPNNNGFQSQATGSQIDLDVRDYLNRSYIEDTDFQCDYDLFSALNGGR
ncbi:unnamed protein product [Sphenostylis stenocarpa]|uniref:AP2/ERF domain-containing protein n=1 Tax=Sphenostylis stenocarpa TaxID=92480 RepID=A0AA86V387_9FABA|nr:unnamed protein product [Sphenostylis stenocarpa]